MQPPDEVPPDKQRLRKVLLQRRARLQQDELRLDSAALTAVLLRHPLWRQAASLAAFVGVNNEPDTRELLDEALAQGKRLYLPRVMPGEPPRLEFLRTESLDDLLPASFGLLEPRPPGGELVGLTAAGLADLDLMLIPGVAFASSGARLGFGMGYYDRTLAATRSESRPVRIGVSLSTFVDPPEGAIPEEPHDVAMEYLLTEHGLHACGDKLA